MTARELVSILKANGWKLDRVRGSHHVFVKPGHRPLPVPIHGMGADVPTGTLKSILKRATETE